MARFILNKTGQVTRWYNLFMHPTFYQRLIVIAFILFLTACAQIPSQSPRLSQTQVTLVPYQSIEATPVTLAVSEINTLPISTLEPVIYTVVAGDSLSVIALRFGVDLNALILANPGVNANAMSVGTKLVIPSVGDTNGTNSSGMTGLPTPVISSVVKPDCYPVDTGRWICFLLVDNTLDEPVGNIIGQVKMAGASVSYTATCPLDLIPAGAAVPLIAHIQGIEIDPDAMTGSVTSAISVDATEAQYQVVQVTEFIETYTADRRAIIIDGEFTPTVGGTLRVLAFAQDAEGHVLGFRLWEPGISATAGVKQPIQINLYSLDGAISVTHLVAQITLE